MKIADFREKLAHLSKEELLKAASELFKALPKAKKENMELLDAILNPSKPKAKKEAKPKEEFSLAEMEQEIELFDEQVKEQLYVFPNRTISKKERSGWRFKVKKWYKELSMTDRTDANPAVQAKLLLTLFKLLQEGEGKYYFVSQNTFSAIGVEDVDFFRTLLIFMLEAEGPDALAMKAPNLIVLTAGGGSFYDITFIEILMEFLGKTHLPTLIAANKKAIEDLSKMPVPERYSNRREAEWYFNSIEQAFSKFGLHLYILAEKVEEGIKFFYRHYKDKRDPEIPIFVLITIMKEYQLYEHCLREMDAAKAKGIELRKQLIALYNSLKNE